MEGSGVGQDGGKWCGPGWKGSDADLPTTSLRCSPLESDLGICGIISPCEGLPARIVVPWAGTEEYSTI